jgi:hypothetical protein
MPLYHDFQSVKEHRQNWSYQWWGQKDCKAPDKQMWYWKYPIIHRLHQGWVANKFNWCDRFHLLKWNAIKPNLSALRWRLKSVHWSNQGSWWYPKSIWLWPLVSILRLWRSSRIYEWDLSQSLLPSQWRLGEPWNRGCRWRLGSLSLKRITN